MELRLPLEMSPGSRAGFFASTRDECLSPRVCLECNPEIPVAPGEEHWLLDTSLDEVYWPCSHSGQSPSFPSQLEWKIGLPWAYTRGILNPPRSEEHTSELQSPKDLVCRLLLEKKKK